MKLKKHIFIILLVVLLFLLIGSVSATDINTNDTQTVSASGNDEILSVGNDVDILGDGEYTYTYLRQQINSGGDIKLIKGNYTYADGDGDTIEITNSGVIDGNGAVIDMANSGHRAFSVTTDGVTIKNLTIKNVNFNGNGGAIYFSSSGTVENCNFADNSAKNGGAIFMGSGSVTNCNFTDNQATGDGGAIRMGSGSVTNCNFTDNQATGDGGAIRMISGSVTNCNFTNNTARYGGAIRFHGEGAVTNCNFVNNTAKSQYYGGGAIYFNSNGNVINCNFTANQAGYCGGAVYFLGEGTVTNCNFTNNTATNGGVAIRMSSGSITNCNFTGNKATGSNSWGGAILFAGKGSVTNCNFTNNTATNGNGSAVYFNSIGNVTNCNFTNNTATNSNGGAVYFNSNGNVTNCNFTNNTATNGNGGAVYFNSNGNVTNCNFAHNSANQGGAIFSHDWYTTADTCIFKRNSGENFNTIIFPPTLIVENFTTFYGSGEKLTFDLKTNSSIPVTNGNISISVYFKDNDSWVGNYSCLSGEGWTVNLPVGSYYAIFNTEYAKFKPINRTVTIMPEYTFWALNHAINANDNSVINLSNDYYFDSEYDSEFVNGVVINRPLTINGNGHTIDALKKARIFKVTAANVVLNNITFANATYNGNGGAIYFSSSGTVENCNFINNTATNGNGGAIRMSSGSVTNCNFTNNTASRWGGAIDFEGDGTVTNCNFTGNKATGSNSWGGAILMGSGSVTNCNFIDNFAPSGGAIWFTLDGNVTNCNFTANQASRDGGAVYFWNEGTVTNCNFTNNTASGSGGAIYFSPSGTTHEVRNCNFTANQATGDGGAIFMSYGSVKNCNFTGNKATGSDSWGGAVFFVGSSNVTNCNFTNNTAQYGGAIRFNGEGTVTNCNFTANQASREGGAVYFLGEGTVTNCNFTGNNATTGSAIFFYKLFSSDTLTISNSTFLNNRANAEDLQVTKNDNNITITFTGNDNLLNAIYSRNDAEVTFTTVTYWSANGITNTGSSAIKPSRSNKEAGQNITVSVIVNDKIVLNEVKVTDENGTIVLPTIAGDNYFIGARHDTDSYYPEKVNTTLNNTEFNVNVTSQTTNNKTVNITAKSNIPNEVIKGKLLFILPNGTEINATYATNGTWWALHTFDDVGDYTISASYIGLDDVIINNGNISIRYEARVDVNNKTLNLEIGQNFTIVATTTPEGLDVTFVQDDSGVYIVDENGNVIALKEGKGSVLVKVGGDGIYAKNSTIVNVTVSKVPTEITVLNDTLVLEVSDEIATGATLTPADAGNLTYTVSNPSIVKVEDGKITALKEGNATITVSFAGNKKYLAAENKTINITVSLNDASVSVNNDTLDLLVDDKFNLNATTEPKDLTVNYTSSNPSVVTVDNEGNVVAIGEGNATITVSVGGDGKYVENSTTVTVTVSKIPTEITIANATVTLNVDDEVAAGATLTPAEAGNLTYTSSDESVAIVKDGKIMALKEGEAVITVSFKGDNKYASAENKTIKVSVEKLNATMDVSADEITEGENATITVTLPSDATGNVSTTVNGKTYSSEVKNGKSVIIIPDLLKGDYTLPITYSGDDKYNPLTKDVNITVEGGKAIISAPDLVKYYSGSERFTVNLTYAKGSPVANTPVNITINGVTYPRTTDENGTASLNINLGAGKYDVTVKTDDVTADSVVTVLSTINASDVESKNKNLVFTAAFIDGTGNPLTDGTLVTFNVKGVIYNSTVKGGKGSASIDLTLDSGRYIITSFNPVSGENASNNIAVDLKDAGMILSGDEITVGENATISVTLPSDATGNVTASVNGRSYSSKVNGGKANIIIPNLSAGNYTIPVTYSGDDKYNSAAGDANVSVNKADAAMTIDAPAITVGENATVTVSLPSDATGSVSIGNESVPVKDGTASAVLTDLPVGTNTIPVTYSGDDKYNSIETSADIIVNEKPVPAKENLTIKATADEITEGENATVIITGLENATGNVSANINGKTYTAPINKGQSTITVPGLTENATAAINYPGDDKYNPAVTTVNITVNRNTVTINAENLTKYYKDSQKFTVTVTDAKGQVAPNKTVDITINGVTYKRTSDENGTASLNINLGAGEYPVSVAVDDVVVNSTVIVMSTIDASDVVKMFRNDTQYYARFTDANGNILANTSVSFNINGVIYNRTTDANGTAKVNINMGAGDYIVTATNPVTGEMKSNNIKVISLIESDDLTKYYKNASQFVVRIHTADGGYVGAGEEVTFNINGVFYTRTTNATGHAKLNINLPQGNYTITTYHKDCSQGNEITVLPLLSADDLVMKYRDGSQFKAKLVDGQGKAYPGQSVQFNINGVLYNRVTGSDGIAKLNINLMSGQYIITSSYNGANIANKITIRG